MVSAAILDGPYPDTGQVGMRAATKDRIGDAGVPPTPAMAHRAATKDRIGVGAVQNRPNGLRDDRDIAGDAGQPAHQRPKTPHSATPRDAPIPHPDAPRPAPPRDAPRKKDDAPS
jgi:hypothetical protein